MPDLPPSLPSPFVVGLAGPIGAGKSRIAAAFGQLGCTVIDADAQARRVLERPDAKAETVARFGEHILAPDDTIDRKRLADIVFRDPAARHDLEQIIHPRVTADCRAARQAARDADAPAAVLDVPLLFEAGLDRDCDVIVYVHADRDARLTRVAASRGWDASELDRRQAVQTDLEAKRCRAHVVIDNNQDPDAVDNAVRSLFDTLRQRTTSPQPRSQS